MRFFTTTEEANIVQTIKEAELNSTGEIRLFIEDYCMADHPVERAREVFTDLKMHETSDRNGVLLYLATRSRQFAIWGDEGIHKCLGDPFWKAEKKLMLNYFRTESVYKGIVAGIEAIGQQLKQNYPAHGKKQNELPDEIIYG